MPAAMQAIVASLFMFIAMLVIAFSYVCVFNIKLSRYLKKKTYARGRERTTVGPFGPGGANLLRGLPYLYSSLDCEDEQILRYKDAIRIGLRYVVGALGATGVSIVLIFVLAVVYAEQVMR